MRKIHINIRINAIKIIRHRHACIYSRRRNSQRDRGGMRVGGDLKRRNPSAPLPFTCVHIRFEQYFYAATQNPILFYISVSLWRRTLYKEAETKNIWYIFVIIKSSPGLIWRRWGGFTFKLPTEIFKNRKQKLNNNQNKIWD